MSALRTQGSVFIAVAVAVSLASVLLPRVDAGIELLAVALLLLVAGVPHGTLDTLFAQRLYRIAGARAWLVFVLVYLAIASAVVMLWWLLPGLFLVAFLLVSVLHFSGDLAPGTSVAARVLYGGAVIVLPFGLHALETERLFVALSGPGIAAPLAGVFAWIALPWLAATLLCAAHAASSTQWLTAAEIAALALLAFLAPPLLAFSVFFCVMHSARHVLRALSAMPDVPAARMCALTLPPMLGTLALAALGWALLADRSPDTRLLQLLFVGLAALTVPHMALVERGRFSRNRAVSAHG